MSNAQNINTIRIATAGSVDDGKSTLIGRLLYDTKSLSVDRLEAIERMSKKRGYDYLDFSLATDGLEVEREQGITIDVAYIYFSTSVKNYIIADTPGHMEYTRNMVTGASVSQASIIVIDARKGVLEQTRRHFFINTLLRIKDVIVAVNKMDLVDYSRNVFESIRRDVQDLQARYDEHNDTSITCMPISALRGENITELSNTMSWYKGDTLLAHLERLRESNIHDESPMRFSVQTAIRPKSETFHDFRGYAGKVYGSELCTGDEVTVLPSGKTTRVREIRVGETLYGSAPAGESVMLRLEDDIHVARGDMIVPSNAVAHVTRNVRATVCWFDTRPLTAGALYTVRHTAFETQARVVALHPARFIVNESARADDAKDEMRMNDIRDVVFELHKPLCADVYRRNKHTGSFIIVDRQTHTTAGVALIVLVE